MFYLISGMINFKRLVSNVDFQTLSPHFPLYGFNSKKYLAHVFTNLSQGVLL